MKALIVVPSLNRLDLLLRLKEFLEAIQSPDEALIVDNGNQKIPINVPIHRAGWNLGISGTWNFSMRRAFVERDFDLLILLQDDILWNLDQIEIAKRLATEHPDVDLLLSPHLFSVQVLRRGIHKTVGFYDERFHPAWCEDDDYALRMIHAGRIYQRFTALDPLQGSIAGGTEKGVKWGEQRLKFKAKWGRDDFGVNLPSAKYYLTNRGITPKDL